jgi:hypothetical protein
MGKREIVQNRDSTKERKKTALNFRSHGRKRRRCKQEKEEERNDIKLVETTDFF